MECPLSILSNVVDMIEESLENECSSVIGTPSSLEDGSIGEADSSEGNASDMESLPHRPKGTRVSGFEPGYSHEGPRTNNESFMRRQAPSLSGFAYHGSLIPKEYFVKLDARFKHNLTAIREERDETLKRLTQAKVTNRTLVKALRAERAKRTQLEERFKLFTSTEIVRIPIWPPSAAFTPPMSVTGNSKHEEFLEPDRPNQFLYDNPLYQGYELNVNIIIFRIKALIEDRRPGKASVLLEEALEKAQKLNYTPIYAKCLYWQGRILHLQGQRRGAAIAFLDAMPCIGRYREGEDLKKWLMKYETYIEDLSSGQQIASPAAVRRRPPRYMCVPAADLPQTP